MNFYLADTHFYDKKCLGYDGRPFVDVDSMNQTLIQNWNKRVGREDTVYLVGDFSFGMGADLVSVSQRLAGHKILIRGNHDNDSNLPYAFEKIYDYLELMTPDGMVILSHYPIASFKDMQKPGTVHIYGHVHNSYEAKLCADLYQKLNKLKKYPIEAYNVGCMQPYMGYTPRTIEELRRLTLQYPLDFSH
jgi:calcineurin-like phosphoesterase family protein